MLSFLDWAIHSFIGFIHIGNYSFPDNVLELVVKNLKSFEERMCTYGWRVEGEGKEASKVMFTTQYDKYWGDCMGNIVCGDGDTLSQEDQGRRVNVRRCMSLAK